MIKKIAHAIANGVAGAVVGVGALATDASSADGAAAQRRVRLGECLAHWAVEARAQ